MEMKQHPLSSAFPAMAADEYQSLVDSITNNGVLNPITTFEGMVLDGWHRFKAATEVGLQCPIVEFDGQDPQAFVIAQNKDRRHIAQGQLALAVASVFQWKPAHREKAAPGAGLSKSTEQMATLAGVSERTMRQAKAVEAKAMPKVIEAVKTGEISVKRAAEIAQLPAKEQATAITAPKPAKSKDKLAHSAEMTPVTDGEDTAKLERAASLDQETAMLREQLVEAHDDIASIAKVLDAGDPLTAALAEAKSARDLARGLQQRIKSMLTEIAELNRSVKYWKKKSGQPA